MPLFNSRTVLKRTEAEKLALVYHPRKFPHELAAPAQDFVAQAHSPTRESFRINPLVAEQTGISGHERNASLEAVEKAALEKVKDLEENAYKEAYAIGLEEGKKLAFTNHSEELNKQCAQLGEIIAAIQELKKSLVNFNEAHIVKLIYYMAERIVMREIEKDPQAILPVLNTIVENSQAEEQVTIRLSPEDHQFLMDSKEKLNKDFNFLKTARLEAHAEIKRGGCIIETNYGIVDATIQERLTKVWDAVDGLVPKVKDQVA